MAPLWLIPLLPILGAAVNGLVGTRLLSKRLAGTVAVAAIVAAFGLSVLAASHLLQLPVGVREVTHVVADWIPPMPLATQQGPTGILAVPWGFRLDPLATVMVLLVSGLGSVIHIYSTARMAGEPRDGFARFFCYLNLLCAFMLVLVLGSTFLVMFVGWQGVALCSYLLIGYWYGNTGATDAGTRAFIAGRAGDGALILGIALIFFTFGTLDIRDVQQAVAAMPAEAAGWGVLSTIGLLIFVGAGAKTVQWPLHVWRLAPRATPTPASTLPHAAMVTAGVYLVGRNAGLFSHAPMVMTIVAVVGVVTALLAVLIGLARTDIGRRLAWLTASQLVRRQTGPARNDTQVMLAGLAGVLAVVVACVAAC